MDSERRNAIRTGFIGGASLALGTHQLSAHAAQDSESKIQDHTAMLELIFVLRELGNDVCEKAARRIETSLAGSSKVSLHLRNANLSQSQTSQLAEALKGLTDLNDDRLRSFSMSYNDTLGDTGAVALAQALPHSLHEIGFVGCGIQDAGGKAILEWATQAPDLNVLCIEDNFFSTETKSLFQVFGESHPAMTLII